MTLAKATLSIGLAIASGALAGCAPETDSLPSERVGHARALIRPDTPGNNLQFNFEASDIVETFGSSDGRFLVHFTRNGPNAVPAADTDSSGTPDFVEQVASVYVDVLAYYESLGFRPPESDGAIGDNGGDDRFDVYLVDFAGVGDGAFRQDSCVAGNPERCIGFMTQENDFVGYGYPSTLIANRILGSHEFFHAVQAAYDVDQGSVFAEGSAVWATESFDSSLNDFEGFVSGYLENPDRPLDQPLPGPVDPFSYGSAIFFQFLSERYDPTAVRLLWERCENDANGETNPQWIEQLDAVVAEVGGSSFADAMVDFATWNLYTASFADPAAAYENGDAYPRVKMEDVSAPFADDAVRVFYASTSYRALEPNGRASMTAALVANPADPSSVEGMSLVLATEDAGALTVTQLADSEAGTETLATTGVDQLVVAVVNTASSGDSKKPGLCIGTSDEVATCKATLFASGGGGGAGGGGVGGGAEGGSGGAAADGDDASDDGCGCRVEQRVQPSGPGLVAIALTLTLLGRRRRRM